MPNAGVTKYAYDNENNLTKITDALLRDTIFHYDALGHVYQTQFPSGLTEDYTYDQQGNLKTKTDRKRNLTTYNYDSLDRLKSKVYNDSTEVDYTYDNANHLKTVGGTAANGTYTLTYDNPGRLKQVDSVYSFLATKTWTVKYTYDAASNRATMVDPQNASTSYVYDTLNRLQTLTSPAGAFGFTYDALGRRLTLTRPNSVNTTYTYDAKSELLSALHKKGISTLDGATYTYGSAGNRLTKQDNRTSVTSTYGYDNIYQLTSSTNGTEAYTYDLVGNRLTSTGVNPYVYNSSNQLTSKPGVTYTYDSNGNTQTKVDSTGTTTYGWDFENRLISVTLPGSGGTVNFKYDPFGRRIQKIASVGSVNAIYVLDGADVLQEVNSTGSTVVARYTMGPGIDQPLAEARGTTTSFYEADGLGSVTSLSKSNGALANTYTYDSFGKQTASTGTVVNNFRYTARELDSETGLMHYRARYYDQSSGRLLSEDPIGFAGGVNRYPYAGSSPVNFRDPSGLDYHVTVDSAGNIVVSASTTIYGPNATNELAQSWQRDANLYWNAGNWKYGKCNVHFNLTFTADPKHNSLFTLQGTDNYIYVTASPITSNSLALTWAFNGFWWQGLTGQDAAHETGHLLLLPDDYGMFSFGDHKGHMMSNSLIRDVVQHEVDDVLKGRVCGCK